MGLYELNKKLTLARERDFIFNQILKLTIKIYSNIWNMNICYYLKFRFPIMHRPFFKILSQNREYIQTHSNISKNAFHFACHKWYLYNNPQWCCSINTGIPIRIVLYLFLYLYEYFSICVSKTDIGKKSQ